MVVFPYISKLETKAIGQHFDGDVFDMSPTSHLWHLLEALTGSAGAGDVVEQTLIARAQESIETTWFRDLDKLFGSALGLPRMAEESYNLNPENDLLTEEERIEVELKDAWYRARLKDLMLALQNGGTETGFMYLSRAITSVEADLYETWQYRDRYDSVGRLTPIADRELVVVPQKQVVSEREKRHFLLVGDRLKPSDSILTITTDGLPVHQVLSISNVGADSSYFEVRKHVTQTINMSTIPPPEYLAEELYAGEQWLYSLQEGSTIAPPTPAFGTCQEFSQWYAFMPDADSQINSATYKVDGKKVNNYSIDFYSQSFTQWLPFPLADSPDNWPGGKNGITPLKLPALTLQGQPYVFPETSQSSYERKLSSKILSEGGEVKTGFYRTPLSTSGSNKTFTPEATISSNPPKPGILL